MRVARYARWLRRAGVETAVGCLARPGPISAELDAAGIPTFSCDARGPGDLWALVRLARHVQRLKPDVIHATLTHANVAARLVGGLLGIPVLTSTATIERERRWHVWIERCTAKLDRGHIVNSRTLVEHVQDAFGLPASRVFLVPPSIDPPPLRRPRSEARRSLRLDDDQFVVLWIGRFDPVKRADLLIAAIDLIHDNGSCVLLAGDGPHRRELEAQAARSSAPSCIRFLGWQSDLGMVLSAADVLCTPSLTEGVPNAVLEAMAFGLPVVGSDIPALRELSDGGRRILIAGGDRPADFAATLQRLRADAALRNDLAGAAAAWACEHLSPEATVAALLRVYRSVVPP